MKPGIRRYNMFWSGLEPHPSSAAPPPGGCSAGLMLVPANATDRAARGYNNYHCYNVASVANMDVLIQLDAVVSLGWG